jgi:hypothetical protein
VYLTVAVLAAVTLVRAEQPATLALGVRTMVNPADNTDLLAVVAVVARVKLVKLVTGTGSAVAVRAAMVPPL